MFSIVVRMERRHLSTPTSREKENHNDFDGFGGGLHVFFMLWMVEWGHGQAQNHCKYNGIRAFFMICLGEWGAWAGSESLEIQ